MGQGLPEVLVVGWCSVRSGWVWCLVPCGARQVRGRFSSGAWFPHHRTKPGETSTSVSLEEFSCDRLQGIL